MAVRFSRLDRLGVRDLCLGERSRAAAIFAALMAGGCSMTGLDALASYERADAHAVIDDSAAPPDATAPDGRDEPPEARDAAAPDVPVDAGFPVDAGSPIDAGPPTGGCFAETRTIASMNFQPTGRAHLAPKGIVGRDDGWVVAYVPGGAPHVAYLDLEGHVRWDQELLLPGGSVFGVGPTAVVFTQPLQRIDVVPGSAEGKLWKVIEKSAFSGSLPESQNFLSVDVLPNGVFRVLTRGNDVFRSRIVELALDGSPPDGFDVRRAQLLPEMWMPSFDKAILRGNLVRTVSLIQGRWRSTLGDFDLGSLGSAGPLALRRIEDVSWDDTGAAYPSSFTSDLRRVLVSRGYGETAEAYLMRIPADGAGPAGGSAGLGWPEALIEGGDRLGVATDRQLTFFRSEDLAPLGELSYDSARGGLPVRAALHGGLAAVVFVRPTEEPGVARLGMRCTAMPR